MIYFVQIRRYVYAHISLMRWGIHLLLQGAYGKLRQSQYEPVQQIYLKTLETARMINRLLNVSRLERGKFNFVPQKFSLTALIDEVIRDFQSIKHEEYTNRIAHLNVSAQPLYINADQERVREILEIVIDNAYNYSPKNPEITISVTETSFACILDYYNQPSKMLKGVRIRVADKGVGISASDRKKIFTKFFRGKNVTSFNTSGLGIGLAYAQSLINLHHGKIEIHSTPRKGTSVDIYFPITIN